MIRTRVRPYSPQLKARLAEKSAVLSKAQALEDMGLSETARTLWMEAASREEHIAPLLDALGRADEAALHRFGAASCHHKAGDASRAINLCRAALAGPLNPAVRDDVEKLLASSLAALDS